MGKWEYSKWNLYSVIWKLITSVLNDFGLWDH